MNRLRLTLSIGIAVALAAAIDVSAQPSGVLQVCVHKQTGAMRKAPTQSTCHVTETLTELALPSGGTRDAAWYDRDGRVAGQFLSPFESLTILKDDAGKDVPVYLRVERWDTKDDATNTYTRHNAWWPYAQFFPLGDLEQFRQYYQSTDCTGTTLVRFLSTLGYDQPTTRQIRATWDVWDSPSSVITLHVGRDEPARLTTVRSWRYGPPWTTTCYEFVGGSAQYLIPIEFSRTLTALFPNPLTVGPAP